MLIYLIQNKLPKLLAKSSKFMLPSPLLSPNPAPPIILAMLMLYSTICCNSSGDMFFSSSMAPERSDWSTEPPSMSLIWPSVFSSFKRSAMSFKVPLVYFCDPYFRPTSSKAWLYSFIRKVILSASFSPAHVSSISIILLRASSIPTSSYFLYSLVRPYPLPES